MSSVKPLSHCDEKWPRGQVVAWAGWDSIPGAIRDHERLLGRQRQRLGQDAWARRTGNVRDRLSEVEREQAEQDVQTLPGEIVALNEEQHQLWFQAEPLIFTPERCARLLASWEADRADVAQRAGGYAAASAAMFGEVQANDAAARAVRDEDDE